jgi:hypothetical protein
MHRGLLIAAFCTLSLAFQDAQAEEPAKSSAPAGSPPSMKMTVTPAATGLWSLKIQNTGESPVRIPADPRLISLEVTRPSGTAEVDKKAKGPPAPPTCTLPADARPSTDEGQELVIPGSRSWSTTFDPVFMCFGARERAALVAGASVKARFGWKPPAAAKSKTAAAPSPPFAVAPVGASVGKVTPLKELESDPVTLTDAVTTKPAPASTTPEPEAPKVYLTLPETMDAAKGIDLSTTVTLANDSDRPITVLFRPDMVQFSVSGPGGSVACGGARSIGSPMRELFVTVGSKARTSLSVLFTATCGSGTFDAPGLYRISAKLDTTQASGRSINVKTWDDVAQSKQPLLLRVREPRHLAGTAPSRPNLD